MRRARAAGEGDLAKLLLRGTGRAAARRADELSRSGACRVACGLPRRPARRVFSSYRTDYGFLQRGSPARCATSTTRALQKYYGSYADFVKRLKALLRADYVRLYAQQQRENRGRREAFIRKNRAGIKSKKWRGAGAGSSSTAWSGSRRRSRTARPRFRFQGAAGAVYRSNSPSADSVATITRCCRSSAFSVRERGEARRRLQRRREVHAAQDARRAASASPAAFPFRTGANGVLRAGSSLAGPSPHAAPSLRRRSTRRFPRRGAPLPRAVRRFGEARDAAGGHALRAAKQAKVKSSACLHSAAAQLFDFGRADGTGLDVQAKSALGRRSRRFRAQCCSCRTRRTLPGLGFARDLHRRAARGSR